jgi:hypothetical protein
MMMEPDDKRRRANDGIIVAVASFAFTIIPVAAIQFVFTGGFSLLYLAGIPMAAAVFFGLIAYMSVGRHDEYDDVELTEILDHLTIFDGHQSLSVDFSEEASMLLSEPVLSSVQGTPPPLLVAGSVVQARVPPHSYTIDPEVQASIERHVAYSLANLPPLPSRLPAIQKAINTEISHHDLLSSVAPTPRETLEAKPLKEAIADLGNQGYTDALLYCLSLSKPGSTDIVLSARGPVIGLGARGIRGDDGRTGFTRSDVLKMLRKARGAVSANLQSDIQTSGEGRS